MTRRTIGTLVACAVFAMSGGGQAHAGQRQCATALRSKDQRLKRCVRSCERRYASRAGFDLTACTKGCGARHEAAIARIEAVPRCASAAQARRETFTGPASIEPKSLYIVYTPTSTWNSVPFVVNPGSYRDFLFRVTAPNRYVFKTCGAASFDTMLDVLQWNGSTTQLLGWNDDYCGLQSLVVVSPRTGTVTVRVKGYAGAGGTGRLYYAIQTPICYACSIAVTRTLP